MSGFLVGASSIGAVRTTLATALLFLPPGLSAGATVLTIPTFGVRSRIYRPVAFVFTLLLMTTGFAFWASYFNGHDAREGVESLKFIFMSLCLVSGYSIAARQKDIQRLALIMSVVLVGWYTAVVEGGLPLPEAFRPPDNNGSAILLFFLAFIITENRRIWTRVLLVVALFAFATMVDSRLLLVLLPFFFLSQPVALSLWRVFLLVLLCIGLYFWTMSVGMWYQWSDLVRLNLYDAVLRVFASAGIPAIASGQDNFIFEVNLNLPTYIFQRIEVDHAHNAFFQVMGSYGLLAALCFIGVFCVIIAVSFKLKNNTLRNQILFLVCAMLIETLISDSRIAYVVFLFVGLQIGAARRQYAESLVT